MTNPLRRLWHRGMRRQGQALPLVALALPVIVGMAGLSVTVGSVYVAQAKLQSAVDAAALAGAREMTSNDPSAPADQVNLITANDPAATHAAIGVTSTPMPAVAAVANATVPGSFASLFGLKSFTLHARALASYGAGQAFNYAVFQGDPHSADPELVLNGDTHVAGSVHSNNDLLLNGHVNATGSCGGDPHVTLNGSTSCSAEIIQPAPQVPMPVWTPQEVQPANAQTIGSPSNPVGMTITGNSSVSGNYIVYGNLTIGGGATVNGHFLVESGSVTVNGNAAITGSLTVFGGGIVLNGNVSQSGGGALALAAFSTNGHASASGGQDGSIVLNGAVTVNSLLYAPDSAITLNGDVTVNGAVVGYTDVLNGNVGVNYSASQVNAAPVQQVALIR